MAHAFRLSNAAAKAMADGFATAAGESGKLRIYQGTQPTDPDTGIGGSTLLAELVMNADAFPAATDANPGGRLTANAITDDSDADATGTAQWFRLWKSDGTTAVADGTCGTTSSEDMQLNTTAIVQHAVVSITSFLLTMPES